MAQRDWRELFCDQKSLVSGGIHFIGALLSLAASAVLIMMAVFSGSHVPSKVVGVAIYGVSMTLLYAASTNYHLIFISPRVHSVLRKIDHMMIYVMIAGTYTPLCLVALRAGSTFWGILMLCLVWASAIAGICLKAFWMRAPRWLSTLTYLVMGWLVVIAIVPLIRSPVSRAALWLLLSGGMFYTVGAVLYALKLPRIKNAWFGFHELFHVLIIAGSVCHWIMMVVGVVPLNW